MFPVGDSGTGGVQCHANWCGPEHTGHLHISSTRIGSRHATLACLGSVWLVVLRNVAQDRLAHGPVLAVGATWFDRTASVLAAHRSGVFPNAATVCPILLKPVSW